MTFRWSDYHELAKKLAADADADGETISESMHRAAVSRSYYAMYHIAKEYAVSIGYLYPYKPDKGSHEDLHLFLGDQDDDVSKGISLRLETCRNFRTVADYKSDIPDDFPEVKRMREGVMERTEDVIGLLAT